MSFFMTNFHQGRYWELPISVFNGRWRGMVGGIMPSMRGQGHGGQMGFAAPYQVTYAISRGHQSCFGDLFKDQQGSVSLYFVSSQNVFLQGCKLPEGWSSFAVEIRWWLNITDGEPYSNFWHKLYRRMRIAVSSAKMRCPVCHFSMGPIGFADHFIARLVRFMSVWVMWAYEKIIQFINWPCRTHDNFWSGIEVKFWPVLLADGF